MPKFVEVPSVGLIEFPDDMDEKQITAAIDKSLMDLAPDLLRDPAAKEQWAKRTTWEGMSETERLQSDLSRMGQGAGKTVGVGLKGAAITDIQSREALAKGQIPEFMNVGKLASDKIKLPADSGWRTAMEGLGNPLTIPTKIGEAVFRKAGEALGLEKYMSIPLEQTKDTQEERLKRIENHPLYKTGEKVEKATDKAFPSIQPANVSRPLGGTAEAVGNIGVMLPLMHGALAAGSMMELGDAFEAEIARQKKDGEDVDVDMAWNKAASYSTVATTIEMPLGIGRILKKVGQYFGKEVAEEAGRRMAREGGPGLFGYIRKQGWERAKDSGAGFTEEFTQRVSQDLIVSGEVDLAAAWHEGMMGMAGQTVIGGVAQTTADLSKAAQRGASRGGSKASPSREGTPPKPGAPPKAPEPGAGGVPATGGPADAASAEMEREFIAAAKEENPALYGNDTTAVEIDETDRETHAAIVAAEGLEPMSDGATGPTTGVLGFQDPVTQSYIQINTADAQNPERVRAIVNNGRLKWAAAEIEALAQDNIAGKITETEFADAVYGLAEKFPPSIKAKAEKLIEVWQDQDSSGKSDPETSGDLVAALMNLADEGMAESALPLPGDKKVEVLSDGQRLQLEQEAQAQIDITEDPKEQERLGNKLTNLKTEIGLILEELKAENLGIGAKQALQKQLAGLEENMRKLRGAKKAPESPSKVPERAEAPLPKSTDKTAAGPKPGAGLPIIEQTGKSPELWALVRAVATMPASELMKLAGFNRINDKFAQQATLEQAREVVKLDRQMVARSQKLLDEFQDMQDRGGVPNPQWMDEFSAVTGTAQFYHEIIQYLTGRDREGKLTGKNEAKDSPYPADWKPRFTLEELGLKTKGGEANGLRKETQREGKKEDEMTPTTAGAGRPLAPAASGEVPGTGDNLTPAIRFTFNGTTRYIVGPSHADAISLGVKTYGKDFVADMPEEGGYGFLHKGKWQTRDQAGRTIGQMRGKAPVPYLTSEGMKPAELAHITEAQQYAGPAVPEEAPALDDYPLLTAKVLWPKVKASIQKNVYGARGGWFVISDGNGGIKVVDVIGPETTKEVVLTKSDPNFSNLPEGGYTYEEALKALAKAAKPPAPAPPAPPAPPPAPPTAGPSQAELDAIKEERDAIIRELEDTMGPEGLGAGAPIDPKVAALAARLALTYAKQGILVFKEFAAKVKADAPQIWDRIKKYLAGAWTTAGELYEGLDEVNRAQVKAILSEIDGAIPRPEEQGERGGMAGPIDNQYIDALKRLMKSRYPNIPDAFWDGPYENVIRTELLPDLTPEFKSMFVNQAERREREGGFVMETNTIESLAIEDTAAVYDYILELVNNGYGGFGVYDDTTETLRVASNDNGSVSLAAIKEDYAENTEAYTGWSSTVGKFLDLTEEELRSDYSINLIYTFAKDVRAAEWEAEKQQEENTPGPESDDITQLLDSDEDNRAKSGQIRRMAKKRDISVKDMEEMIEAEIVRRAHLIASNPNISAEEKFSQLRDEYERQPLLSSRTAGSVGAQAYSTPSPLAFANAHMTGVTPTVSVHDRTAGNGMLMIGSNLQKGSANETNKGRVENLKKLGVPEVTTRDATQPYPNPPKANVVALNPPFGSSPVQNYNGFGIRRLEHIIALRGLESMQDTGLASIIVGAKREEADQGKGAQWVFENYLYGHFNVVGNFEVSGELYGKQGAKWPVRVLIVAGRKAQPVIADLAPKRVDRLNSWQEVWERAESIRNATESYRRNLGSENKLGLPPSVPKPETDTGQRPVSAPTGQPAQPPDRGGVGGGTGGSRAPTAGVTPTGGATVAKPETTPRPAIRPKTPATAGGTRKPTGGLEGGDTGSPTAIPNVTPPSPQSGAKPDTRKLPQPPPISETGGAQVQYNPASDARALGTLSPRNIANGMRMALQELRDRLGNSDEFVANRLNMMVEEVKSVLAAEQIDGVALSIDQMENGDAVIIGDQTGIGKGRQAAAIIRYAILNGKIPVFFTKDPKLFSDMWRDLQDINTTINPMILGGAGKADIVSEEGTVIKKAQSSLAKQQRLFAKAKTRGGLLQQGFDSVFLTYSQIRDAGSKDPKTGAYSKHARQQFLEDLGNNEDVVLVLDESHEAAGDLGTSMQAAFMAGGEIERGKGRFKQKIVLPGILNLPGTKRGRGGVVYLSATFAKRADNMMVYFRTALSRAADNMPQIVTALAKGGVALQQAVSESLAAVGQYIRRERDFSDSNYEMKRIEVADMRELLLQVNSITGVLAEIVKFSDKVIEASKGMDFGSTAMGENEASMSPFASIVHNQISQLLLAAKSEEVVLEAVRVWKNGEKPVIALMNTMESFLDQWVTENDVKEGQKITLRWNELVEYALTRTLRATIKGPNGEQSPFVIDPKDIGLDLEYNRIREAAMDIQSAFPVSPIDYIIQRLQEEGVPTGELTGRTSGIQYTDYKKNKGTYKRFRKADKNALVNGFNSGKLGGLLLNASGSTGLSIHASESFPERPVKPRRMIIAQAALDINVFVQTLGRILRTGMIPGGANYMHLVLPLQAEMRPAAVSMQKMKSLNANTTAESENAVKIEAVDFLNKYGDQVVADYLDADFELQQRLSIYIEHREDGSAIAPQDTARKFSGRLALLSDEEQQQIYGQILPNYKELIEQLKTTGEYDLEITIHDDWDATLESDMELVPGTDETNYLTASVRAQQYEVTDNRHVPTGEEMEAEFAKNHGDAGELQAKWDQFKIDVAVRFNAMLERLQEDIAEIENSSKDQRVKDVELSKLTTRRDKLKQRENSWNSLVERLEPMFRRAGTVISIQNNELQELYEGMLVGVKLPDISDRLVLAPSAFKFRYLVDAPGGRIYVPGSGFMGTQWTESSSFKTTGDFKGAARGQRYNRWFVTGNPIRGYAATDGKGKVVRFNTRDGQVVTAIKMPSNWDISQLANDPRKQLLNGAAADSFLANGTQMVSIEADNARINRSSSGVYGFSVPSARRTGGKYYLDPTIQTIVGNGDKSRGEARIRKQGNRMLAEISRAMIQPLVDRIGEIAGTRLTVVGGDARTIDDVARANASAKPDGDGGGGGGGGGTQARPPNPDEQRSRTLEQLLDDAIRATDFNQGRAMEGITGAPIWITKGALNSALRVIRLAVRAGKSLAQAIQDGVEHIKSLNDPRFDAVVTRDFFNEYFSEEQRKEEERVKQVRLNRSKAAKKTAETKRRRKLPEAPDVAGKTWRRRVAALFGNRDEKTAYRSGKLSRFFSTLIKGNSLGKSMNQVRDWGMAFQEFLEESGRLLTKDMNLAIAQEFPKREHDAVRQRVLDFLEGRGELNGIGGPQVQLVAAKIRANIDKLSKLSVDNGLVSSSMAETWLENTGIWLRRTYLAFDPSSDWNMDALERRKNKGDREITRIWNALEEYLQEAFPESDEGEIRVIMRQLIDRQEVEDIMRTGEMGTVGTGDQLGVNIGSLIRRKDIPKVVRDWMGEITDPNAKVLQSFKWMSQFITRNLVQRKFARIGLELGWLSEKKTDPYSVELYPNTSRLAQKMVPQLNEDGEVITDSDDKPIMVPAYTPDGEIIAVPRQRMDRRYAPLHGLYTTIEFANALKEYETRTQNMLEVARPENVLWSIYKRAVSYSKLLLVGLNPYSYPVNGIGGFVMRLAAGGTSPLRLRRAFDAVRLGEHPVDAYATKRELMARADYLMATKAGVTGKGIIMSDVRANLRRDADKNVFARTIEAVKRIAADSQNKSGYRLLIEAMEDALAKPGDLGIRFLDDVYRVDAFLYELEVMSKAYPESTREEQVDMAADRAANVYQTYDRVWQLFRGLSNAGILGTFVTFKLELMRNTFWIAYYAAKGAASGNAALRVDAARKGVGLSAMISLPFLVAAIARDKTDTDDDEMLALKRWIVPPWDMAEVIFPIERNGTEWRYVPMSYLLPHVEMTRIMTAAYDASRTGNPQQAFKQAVQGLASDYLGPGVLGGTILAFASNQRESGGPITRREGAAGMVDRIKYAADNLKPGFMRPARELYYAATGQKMPYNKEPSARDVGLKLLGLRVRRVDVKEDMRWTMMDFGTKWRATAADATIRVRRAGEGSDEATEAMEYTVNKKEEIWRMYQEFRRDMILLGVEDRELASAEKEQRVPNDLRDPDAY